MSNKSNNNIKITIPRVHYEKYVITDHHMELNNAYSNNHLFTFTQRSHITDYNHIIKLGCLCHVGSVLLNIEQLQ